MVYLVVLMEHLGGLARPIEQASLHALSTDAAGELDVIFQTIADTATQ